MLSGKTVFAEVMLIEYLCKRNTFNGYISPSFSQGKKVYSELISILEPTGIIKKANASELKIETIFNSTLKFFSLESATAIRGYTFSGILVLDEMAFFPTTLPSGEEPYYNIIFPTIKARKPKVLCISTPNGRQGCFYDLYMRAFKGEQGYAYIDASIYDDEFITKEEIEKLKQNYPPLAWKQEFEIQWLDNALTVFPNFESCFDIAAYRGAGKCWCGIDPSTNGQDSTILTFVNERNDIKQFVIDGSLDEKYEKIAKMINVYNPTATYIEANSIGTVMANEIRKLLKRKYTFIEFQTTNETKKEYISLLSLAIANNNIHFEKDNKLLYSELSTYTFKLTKAGNITYAARDGYHDDTISSLAIALQCKENTKYTVNQNVKFARMKELNIR